MKVSPNATFNHFLPSSEVLWETGGATMRTIEPDPGRHVEVPFFAPEFTRDPSQSRDGEMSDFVTKHHRVIGRKAVHNFQIDNVDYRVRVLLPDERQRTNNDLTIVSSMAWMTALDGYNGDRDAKLVIDNHVPLISIGSPFSSPETSLIKSAIKAPSAAWRTRHLSLAYSAEVEQMIISTVRDLYAPTYDIPSELLLIGDSRGANIKSAQFAYAPNYENTIVAFDTKGRAGSQKIELGDVPEVAMWLGATVLAGVVVGAHLLRRGRGDLLKGTGSLDPKFLTASITGTMRSLASGETGKTIDWVPYSAHGHDVLYGLDSLCDYRTIDSLWENHDHVVRKIVYSGTHAALLHPQAHATQRKRIERFIDNYRENDGVISDMDWESIYHQAA